MFFVWFMCCLAAAKVQTGNGADEKASIAKLQASLDAPDRSIRALTPKCDFVARIDAVLFKLGYSLIVKQFAVLAEDGLADIVVAEAAP